MKFSAAALATMLSLSACTAPSAVEVASPQAPVQTPHIESAQEVRERLLKILEKTEAAQSSPAMSSPTSPSRLPSASSYRGNSYGESLNGWEEAEVRSKYVNGRNYLIVEMGLSGGTWLVEKPLLLSVPSWGGTYLVKPRILGGIDAIIDESGDPYEFMFEKQTRL